MTKISADTNGRGRFITFEGIDGAGKTSQIDACEAFLREKGIRVVRTREPGGTVLGEKIRAMLLADDMVPLTETLLFFASRAEHIAQVIERATGYSPTVLRMRPTPIRWEVRASIPLLSRPLKNSCRGHCSRM